MFTVAVCESLADLEALRPAWQALLAEADTPSVFDDWAWTAATWRYGAPGKRPCVITVRDETGHLIGLLPLARAWQHHVVPRLEVIGCTPSGYPQADYGGLLARSGRQAAVWQAVLAYLAARRDWAILDLRNCPASALPPAFDRLPTAQRGWLTTVRPAERCPRLALGADFDDYLARLSANARQQIRRKLRKLQGAGFIISQVDNQDAAARDAALRTLFGFFETRWDHTAGDLPRGRALALHTYFAAELVARAALDLRIVQTPTGATVGVIYNFRRGDTGYFYMIGLSPDPQWQPYSLGVCLLADSIAAATQAGCRTFDLLRGDHEYKRHFGGQHRETFRVTLYRYRWLAALEETARHLRRRLKSRQPAGPPAQPTPEAA